MRIINFNLYFIFCITNVEKSLKYFVGYSRHTQTSAWICWPNGGGSYPEYSSLCRKIYANGATKYSRRNGGAHKLAQRWGNASIGRGRSCRNRALQTGMIFTKKCFGDILIRAIYLRSSYIHFLTAMDVLLGCWWISFWCRLDFPRFETHFSLLVLILIKFLNARFQVIIPVEQRSRYYYSLQLANEGDLRPFIRFIAEQTDRVLEVHCWIL